MTNDINTKIKGFKNETTTVEDKKPKPGKYMAIFKANMKNKNFKRDYRGKTKVTAEKFAKYSRGTASAGTGIKTGYHQVKFQQHENHMDFAVRQAARAEILLNKSEGFIEPDEGFQTVDYTQADIVANVDITSATKHFNLQLNDFGPYRSDYTKNGRHLLLGGKLGHVAAFDWLTKKLHCEINVMEEVTDVSWLHVETMFAVAQKNWVHVYDNQGVELHCLKQMNLVNRMEFLPYHFLLATGNQNGFLAWLDITVGEIVSQYPSKLGPIRLMCQNPANGVLCVGSSKGVVSMWSPSCKEPLAQILCHSTPVTAVTVDPRGKHLATAGLDRMVKIWDLRQLDEPLQQYKIGAPASNLELSQKDLIAMSFGNICEVYRQTANDSEEIQRGVTPYLRERCADRISDMRFCPFEDILGIATDKGFTSILVPGAGESDFDAYEANPLQTKSQRRENEVRKILDKVPMEFIALDPSKILGVDVPTLRDKVNAKKKILFLKPQDINIKSNRNKKRKERNKKIIKETNRKEIIGIKRSAKRQIHKDIERTGRKSESDAASKKPKHVLDRFKPKVNVKTKPT